MTLAEPRISEPDSPAAPAERGRSCRVCLYDDRIPAITFDATGLCSFCKLHAELEVEYPTGPAGEAKLAALVEDIRRVGRGKPYDCVVGVSGGCDSSYLLYQMKARGLRPLAAHFDNTWNSTIATTNIQRVTRKLGVDLFTYVVDNKEYDDLYRAFLRAGVPDIEAPTDIALATTLYLAAERYGLSYIVEGHSFRTEGISPLGWLYMDARYIADVHAKFGTLPLRTFPNLWLHRQLKWMVLRRIKRVRPLYYMDYRKEDAKALLAKEFGWQWYGGHHLENRFTAFYHRYFMPLRFGIDTRLLGYSALIRSGQMSRAEAAALMQWPPHEEPEVKGVVEMVTKRLGLGANEFTSLMNTPRHSYREFGTYKRTFERMRPFLWLMYRLDLVPKSFYLKFARKTP